MSINVFSYQDYRNFLSDWIADQPSGGYGIKSKISNYINCKPSHLTQVIKGTSNFSEEQTEDLNHFLELSEEESLFFLNLVRLEKAGSVRLRQRIQNELDKMKKLNERSKIKSKDTHEISPEEKQIYYRSWEYAAIHVAISSDKINSVADIRERLKISDTKVREVISYLLSINLIKEKDHKYQITERFIFLDKQDPIIELHHKNWRLKAMQNIGLSDNPLNIHFSTIIGFSESQLELVRESLINGISRAREAARESEKTEEVYSINLDFFSLL